MTVTCFLYGFHKLENVKSVRHRHCALCRKKPNIRYTSFANRACLQQKEWDVRRQLLDCLAVIR